MHVKGSGKNRSERLSIITFNNIVCVVVDWWLGWGEAVVLSDNLYYTSIHRSRASENLSGPPLQMSTAIAFLHLYDLADLCRSNK